jgi:hypothetical protein
MSGKWDDPKFLASVTDTFDRGVADIIGMILGRACRSGIITREQRLQIIDEAAGYPPIFSDKLRQRLAEILSEADGDDAAEVRS